MISTKQKCAILKEISLKYPIFLPLKSNEIQSKIQFPHKDVVSGNVPPFTFERKPSS